MNNRSNGSASPSPSPSASPSPSPSPSPSSSSCSPLRRSSPWLLSSGLPTTIYVQLPADDWPHGALLRQTEIVYDQMLAERQRKLQLKIDDRRSLYREKYDQLTHTDQTKASEFERWATAALRQLKTQCSKELNELREDYESKFVKMRISLEEQLMADDYSLSTSRTSTQQHQQPHHQPMHLTDRY